MIWLRRFFAIPFIMIFFMLFMPMLVMSRFQATALNPSFYIAELRKANVYNFCHDKLVPTLLDETEGHLQKDGEVIYLRKFKEPIRQIARETMPPEWLQLQVETSLQQFMPFILGNTDQFTLSLDAKSRILALQKSVHDILENKKVGDTWYDLWIEFITETIYADLQRQENVFAKLFQKEELKSMVRRLAPQEWLTTIALQLNDQCLSYFAGERDHFVIKIDFASCMKAVRENTLQIFDKPEMYAYVLGQRIVPTIFGSLGQELPFGITVSHDEIVAIGREVLPQPWFKEQMGNLARQVCDYLDGTTETVAAKIPLTEIKASLVRALTRLVNDKLRSLWLSLPEGKPEQTEELLGVLKNGQLPAQRPAGMSYEELQHLLDLDFGKAFGNAVEQELADQLEISQAQLEQSLNQRGLPRLSELRTFIAQGWSYSDAQLHHDLGQWDSQELDKARSQIKSGFTLAEADLYRHLGARDLRDFQDFRYVMRMLQNWLAVAWVVMVLILVIIAALCSETTAGKVVVGAVMLGIVAAMALVVTFIYNDLGRPELTSDLRAQMIRNIYGRNQVAQAVVIHKSCDFLVQTCDSFVDGIRFQAILALALAGLAAFAPGIMKRFTLAAAGGTQDGVDTQRDA